MKNNFLFIFLFYSVLCFESLGQVDKNFEIYIEDGVTPDNIIKIFPLNKHIFQQKSINYFKEKSVNDTSYENGYFIVYDFYFTVDKLGNTNNCKVRGNPSTYLTIKRKEIMIGYCRTLLKKCKWDIDKFFFIKSKYSFYIRVVKYKGDKYQLYIGNEIDSRNGYEL